MTTHRLIACALAVAATYAATFAATAAPPTPTGTVVSMNLAVRARVPAVEFDRVALADVFDFLRDVSGLNLHVNWPALEAAGVNRSVPVSIELRQITLAKVLDLTLAQASGAAGDGGLAWYVSGDVLHVTTRDLADRELVTRVYPVQDLLVEVPNFKGPSIAFGDNGASGGGGGNGDGGGAGVFGGAGDADDGEPATTRRERGEKLVALVVMLVTPEVWVANGGYASIRYFHGSLIVTAPRRVQAMIGR